MPLSLRRGVVTAVLERHEGVARVEVDGVPCVGYPLLTGPVALGDEVIVNTQARDLSMRDEDGQLVFRARPDQRFERPARGEIETVQQYVIRAAHGGVDLRQQRRGRVDQADTTQIAGGGEADQVAHDAAAEGDERVTALRPLLDQPVPDRADLVERLVAFEA